MRKEVAEKLEQGRQRRGPYASETGELHGAFLIWGPRSAALKILSSGTDYTSGWEHVSVSCTNRPPNWDEMCYVKNLFWYEDEAVVQFHPPKALYVNHHPHCLHLWRPLNNQLYMPDPELVGPLDKREDDADHPHLRVS